MGRPRGMLWLHLCLSIARSGQAIEVKGIPPFQLSQPPSDLLLLSPLPLLFLDLLPPQPGITRLSGCGILSPVHASAAAVPRSTRGHIVVFGIPLGQLGRGISDIFGRKIEARKVTVDPPGVFSVPTLAAFVDEEFHTAGNEERAVPKFDQIGSYDRTFGGTAILLGGFRNGKSTEPGICKVLHKSDPILVVDVVSSKDGGHPRHTLRQVIHILDLEILKVGIGLCGVRRSVETFRGWQHNLFLDGRWLVCGGTVWGGRWSTIVWISRGGLRLDCGGLLIGAMARDGCRGVVAARGTRGVIATGRRLITGALLAGVVFRGLSTDS